MPKRGRKFITEFLVPSLNDERFGARLAWVDRGSSVFQMHWNHKSASAWTADDCQVFVDWDKKRGHYRPLEKDYFPKSKQRFRAVLNKSIQDNEITALQSEDKNIKLYFLGPLEAVPFDLKFDVLKDAVDDKNDLLKDFLNSSDESKLLNSLLTIEGDQSTKVSYCNALKDHNYQNIDEHQIPDSNEKISCDATLRNDLSFYPADNEEKIAHTSFNILDTITIDEKFLENLPSAVLGQTKESHISLQNNLVAQDYYKQVFVPDESHMSANSLPNNLLIIPLKRGFENSDCCYAKKIKLVLCDKTEP